MPILVPIIEEDSIPATVEGIMSGGTDMTGALTIGFGVAGQVAGGTQLSGSLGGTYRIAGAVVGATAMSGSLRINSEANVFLAGALVGDTALQGDFGSKVTADAVFAGSTQMTGTLSVLPGEEPYFVIAADILDSAIASMGNIRRYAAKLLADGVEVNLRRATLEAQEDTLGTELRVTLAKPDAGLVALAASIEFRIGLWNGSTFLWVTLVSGGKLSGRGNILRNEDERPADEVTLSVADVVADRWNRAPRQPIHLYDPQMVPAPTQSDLISNRIETLGDGFIETQFIAVPGMRLRDVLSRAYVTGCGFAAVVCNIPNFPVQEADFTLDGGYDAGVRPLLAPFEPVVFERNNTLYVVDVDAPLPAGMSARDLTHAQTREISDSIPQREPVNSLLLRVKDPSGTGEFYTERLDTETKSAGVFGTSGYTETDTERRIREYRNFVEPTVIIREEIVSERTRVLDASFTLIEETTENLYFDSFHRRTGSVKRTSMLIPDLNNDGVLTFMSDVTRQEQAITYVTDPRDPTKDLQDRVVTELSGLVLVDDDTQYLDEPYRISVLDAHRSGYIDPNANQHLETMSIRTTIEQLRVRGEQVDVETRVIDHISNAPLRNASTTRPATADISRSQQARLRTILLTVPGTDATSRRAQTLDAGDLPYDVALTLGQRKLSRLNSPPREVQASPGYVDLTIRRGTVLSLKKRGGSALGNYIVRGWSIEFEAYEQQAGVRATMALRARELLT